MNRVIKIFALAGFAVIFCGKVCLSNERDIKKSVVKIITTEQAYNYLQPWQKKSQKKSSGSGAIIDGKRILTNAHVVSNQIFIQVQKAGDPKTYTAKVEFTAHDSDLAVLKVKDESFFNGTKPLKLGGFVKLKDKVNVYGFPKGGDKLSITEGIVSRIEMKEYTHSKRSLLAIQIDAAINDGNSGGPVIKNGRIVGVAFQGLEKAENIGRMVPVPIIKRFFEDIKDGGYDEVPYFGIFSQKMENESLRKFYKVPQNVTGILVKRIFYGSSAWGKLKRGDIITFIGGFNVANDKTIALNQDERVVYTYTASLYQIGENVPVNILRNGSPMKIMLKMKKYDDLVIGPFYDIEPSYYVYGGFYFTKLTKNYLSLWGENPPTRFDYQYLNRHITETKKETVVIGEVFPHDINVGYHTFADKIVSSINGVKINKLADIIKAFKNPAGSYHIIELDYETEDGTKIILDAAETQKVNGEILKRFNITKDRSDNLKNI
jgi:S1-C subfamily serine protease